LNSSECLLKGNYFTQNYPMNFCALCHLSCLTCNGPNINNCLTCDPDLALFLKNITSDNSQNLCVNQCGTGLYGSYTLNQLTPACFSCETNIDSLNYCTDCSGTPIFCIKCVGEVGKLKYL